MPASSPALMAVLALTFLVACRPARPPGADRLRTILAAKTGVVRLPGGVIEIDAPLVVENASDLTIEGAQTTLRAAANYKGRALLELRDCRRCVLRGVAFDGRRARTRQSPPLPPSNVAFADHFPDNALLVEGGDDVKVELTSFREVAGFAILVHKGSSINIDRVTVENNGTLDERGRNNTTGGILIEEGTKGFRVTNSTFRRVYGNGVWTHSNYSSPRSETGLIENNQFEEIARDAIQVGHAYNVRVLGNTGHRIGYPEAAVDIENGAVPVAIDTSGDVDHSVYEGNKFTEINGKCIDLDGFHDGAVRHNSCFNKGRAIDYPFGQFAIVINNTNPDMESRAIVIEGNTVNGSKFGGVFVIGSDHHIRANVFRNLNLAQCPEGGPQAGCAYPTAPRLLEAGVYLGAGGTRPAPSKNVRVTDNQIAGHKMSSRCVVRAPEIELHDNFVERNQCQDSER